MAVSMRALLGLIAGLAIVTTAIRAHLHHDPDLDDDWKNFKKHHGKKYKNKEEESHRRHIFEEHVEHIQQHNLHADFGKHHHRMGVTKFADWTREEFKKHLTYNSPTKKVTSKRKAKHMHADQLPTTVNWVTQGAVTPVKDQGQCGGCYTFSSTGALEGQVFRKSGQLVSLSEENLLDCSSNYNNQDCNGGTMQACFQYVQDNGGLDTEASYPYTSGGGVDNSECSYDADNSAATVSNIQTIESGDEQALAKALASVGPISIAIDASNLQFYKGGVYADSNCSSSNLDHAVLLVGYGVSSNGQQYWLVKNSWGTNWGLNGYFELARNQNNMCGVATDAVYPEL